MSKTLDGRQRVVRCPKCGANNHVIVAKCVRCQEPLAGVPSRTVLELYPPVQLQGLPIRTESDF